MAKKASKKTAKSKKSKSTVCFVCGKNSKPGRKTKCCPEDMLDKKRGTWNA